MAFTFDNSTASLTKEMADSIYVKHGFIGEKILGTFTPSVVASDAGILTFIEGSINLTKGSYIIYAQIGIQCNRMGTLTSTEISISTDPTNVDKSMNSKSVNISMKKSDIISQNLTAVVDVADAISTVYFMVQLKYATGDFKSVQDYFNLYAVRVS